MRLSVHEVLRSTVHDVTRLHTKSPDWGYQQALLATSGGCMTIEAPGMREQIPAQSVIEELLREQQTLPPRSRLATIGGRSPLAADSVAWYLGAQGEIEVGKILSPIPPEWSVSPSDASWLP